VLSCNLYHCAIPCQLQKNLAAKIFGKGIILFGLNTATNKMALAKNLMDFSKQGKNTVYWHEIADSFYSST
jgi:hypothetical protein